MIGASIDPTSGLFSWTPGEADGPGDYTVTVYAESELPGYMQGKVAPAPYRAAFPAALEQVR